MRKNKFPKLAYGDVFIKSEIAFILNLVLKIININLK
jgi:hypothetical protein